MTRSGFCRNPPLSSLPTTPSRRQRNPASTRTPAPTRVESPPHHDASHDPDKLTEDHKVDFSPDADEPADSHRTPPPNASFIVNDEFNPLSDNLYTSFPASPSTPQRTTTHPASPQPVPYPSPTTSASTPTTDSQTQSTLAYSPPTLSIPGSYSPPESQVYTREYYSPLMSLWRNQPVA